MLYTSYVQSGETIKGFFGASVPMYYRILENTSPEHVGTVLADTGW